MKITATKENLLFGVSAVQRAVNTKNTLAILTCIKIEAKEDYLYFTATDLEVGIQCKIPAEVIVEGITVVPARYFTEIVRKLPDSVITMELIKDNQLIISYENSELNLKTMAAEEFPKLPEVEGEHQLTIEAAKIKQMVKQIVFACSTDENRPLFTGVLCEIDNNEIRMISTDTHRLALKRDSLQNKQKNKFNFIVPSKILAEMARLIQDEEGLCEINIAKNLATFTIDNIQIVCRLFDGQFPNYQQVIPSQYTLKIRTGTKALQEAVERISLFSLDNSSNTINLEIEKNSLKLFSQSELGQGHEQILINTEGDPVKIAFNYRYLLDVFRVIDDEELTIEFTGPLSPGIIRPVQSDTFLYLVLPVRC
jgi:DNA polymerase-3 subunit beta